MNSTRLISHAATLATLAFCCLSASATPISGSASGLVAPKTTITFDEHVLGQDTHVTTQYADLGVTFDPGLYDTPDDPDVAAYDPYIVGHFLGNYVTGQDSAALGAIRLTFSTLQTRAAFGLAANGSDFTFEAFLGNTSVASFGAVVDGASYYGFSDELFDSIVVTSLGSPYEAGAPDFFDFDNLQFDALPVTNAPNPAVVPEPEVGALLGLGLIGALAARRRSRRAA